MLLCDVGPHVLAAVLLVGGSASGVSVSSAFVVFMTDVQKGVLKPVFVFFQYSKLSLLKQKVARKHKI
jgi:hypothetical protein